MVLRTASCPESSLWRMERPRGFVMCHMFRGQWPEKRFSYAKSEAAEDAECSQRFSDRVTLRPPALCPAGITARS